MSDDRPVSIKECREHKQSGDRRFDSIDDSLNVLKEAIVGDPLGRVVGIRQMLEGHKTSIDNMRGQIDSMSGQIEKMEVNDICISKKILKMEGDIEWLRGRKPSRKRTAAVVAGSGISAVTLMAVIRAIFEWLTKN
jgi:TolA-binding protein